MKDEFKSRHIDSIIMKASDGKSIEELEKNVFGKENISAESEYDNYRDEMKRALDDLTRDLSKEYAGLKGVAVRCANFLGFYSTEKMINDRIHNTEKTLLEVKDLVEHSKEKIDSVNSRIYENDYKRADAGILVNRYEKMSNEIDKEIELKKEELQAAEREAQTNIENTGYIEIRKEINNLAEDKKILYNKTYKAALIVNRSDDVEKIYNVYLSDIETRASRLEEAELLLSTSIEKMKVLSENGISPIEFIESLKKASDDIGKMCNYINVLNEQETKALAKTKALPHLYATDSIKGIDSQLLQENYRQKDEMINKAKKSLESRFKNT